MGSPERPFYERCKNTEKCDRDDYSFDLLSSPCYGCLSDYEKRILLDMQWMIDFFPRANADADAREARENKENDGT